MFSFAEWYSILDSSFAPRRSPSFYELDLHSQISHANLPKIIEFDINGQINSYAFIRQTHKRESICPFIYQRDLHRLGWYSCTSIFLASSFIPQLSRVTAYLIVCFFSTSPWVQLLFIGLKWCRCGYELRIRMDPLSLSRSTFCGINPILQHISKVPF